MTAEAAAVVSTFRVGRRTVTLTIEKPTGSKIGSTTAEWSPDMPKRLSPLQWRQYRAGRDAAIASLAKKLDINPAAALVIEP